MGAGVLLLGGGSGKVSAATAASSALAASSVGNGRCVAVASLQRRGRQPAALRHRGSAWQWRHTTAVQKPQHQRCRAAPELWRGEPDDGKMGFEKEILRAGTGPKPVKGQQVTVHCTGYGKNGDLSQKFWSTKDSGQQPFEFKIGMGSVIKGWDEGVIDMQVGEIARIKCSPDYGYGASGFPAWGIQPNSELIFEIEVLRAK